MSLPPSSSDAGGKAELEEALMENGNPIENGDVEAQASGRLARQTTLSSKVKYYAGLAVSRNPVQYSKEHEEAEVQALDDPASPAGDGGVRFRHAVWRIREGMSIRRHAKGVDQGDGADRFAAAVALERKLESHPHKESLLAALRKRQNNDYSGFTDRLINELFILGQRVFDLFTPKSLHSHTTFFTFVFTILLVVPFCYMAGEFARFELNVQRVGPEVVGYGPKALTQWMVSSDNAYEFNSVFLIKWGGRYLPKMKNGQDIHRWVTSLLLHLDFQHIINNLILFWLFSSHLEHKYGTWRIALLTFLAGIGGNFLSAAFEDPCLIVVGASGCCFGLMGLFVADMVLNIETVSFPILRGLFILLMVILNIYTILTSEGTSNISHLGGFVAGLFPSFIFLPNLKWEKYEASFPFLGGFTMVFFFLCLPIYLYAYRINALDTQCR
ncbi:hypothetical protein BSKO_00152 [Bryopsis sp. KO-2023]|nr:hypothetical protein BSKO_00152 [Bryopsis sp. KO-2023]